MIGLGPVQGSLHGRPTSYIERVVSDTTRAQGDARCTRLLAATFRPTSFTLEVREPCAHFRELFLEQESLPEFVLDLDCGFIVAYPSMAAGGMRLCKYTGRRNLFISDPHGTSYDSPPI